MDAATALVLINKELARNGQPFIALTEEQSQRSFAALRSYAAASGRPLEAAVKDLVRFQLQTMHLQQLRRQS